MTVPAIISHMTPASVSHDIGGLPLVVRHVRECHRLGIQTFYLDGATHDAQRLQAKLPADVVLQVLPDDPASRAQQIQQLAEASEAVLMLRGDWLIDPRLLGELTAASRPIWLPSVATDSPTSSALTPGQDMMVAARLSPELTRQWGRVDDTVWLPDVPALDVGALDTYRPSHRGRKPFYLQAVTTPAEGEAATQTIIQAAQKHTLDLPAQWLHPFFENRLVRLLCNTPITPNHVTLFTAFLGAAVGLLFLNGILWWGAILAYIVAILDGVDGKLARTKLQTSRLGEVEHVIDFFVEQSWYLCLTLYLAGRADQPVIDPSMMSPTLIIWIGGVLMASDVFDKLLYMWGHMVFGKQLDELGVFERRFRLIGGRRNVYLWFFLIGFGAGYPVPAFMIASVWALCTALIHSARFLYHLRYRAPREAVLGRASS